MLHVCGARSSSESRGSLIGTLSKHAPDWAKALMRMDYFGRTLRLSRINISSAEDNVIVSMQSIYSTFLEEILIGHLSFPTLIMGQIRLSFHHMYFVFDTWSSVFIFLAFNWYIKSSWFLCGLGSSKVLGRGRANAHL